jgi:hypothetical protein
MSSLKTLITFIGKYLFQVLCIVIWVTFPPLGVVVGLFWHMANEKKLNEK